VKPLLQSETFVGIAAPLAVGVILIGMWEIGCRLASIPAFTARRVASASTAIAQPTIT